MLKRKYIKLFLGVVVFSAIVKIYVGEIYKVSSSSMEQSMVAGDLIWVNKLKYGPRWPRTPMEIPWINFFAINKNLRPYFINTNFNYIRWPKFFDVELNDIVVFNSITDKNTLVVKRVVGLPGDTLQIIDNDLYLNQKQISNPISVQFQYEFVKNSNSSSLSKVNFKKSGSLSPFLILSDKDADNWNEQNKIENIQRKIGNGPTFNLGPIIIPYKGLTVRIDDPLLDCFQHKGGSEELEAFSKWKGLASIDSNFVFKENYYFTLGDNRHQSQDSRFWGLLNESSIIGNVSFRFFR